MAKTLRGLVITEVDQIIHETKTLKEAAAKIGVAYQTLLQFRSENMKEFKKLKAEREQGLIVDEVPVVKTKPVEKNKGASSIPINDVVDKAEHQKIVDDLQVKLSLVSDDRDKHKEEVTKLNAERNDFMNKIKELEATITKKDEELQLKELQIKAKERDIKSLQHSYDRLDKKSADALKMNDRFLTSKYEKELNQHKRTIEVSAEANKNLKESLQRANQVIKDYQDKETELVTSYEQQLEEKDKLIEEWKVKHNSLQNQYNALKHEDIDKEERKEVQLDKKQIELLQSQLQQEIETSKQSVERINPPSHYAPNGLGTDVIGFLESQFSYEAYKGFMVGNIIKYATRTGRKDEEINELKKIVDYADRIISFLERDNKVADAR
ncbi:DUF3310 domain-containing protein [Macrococcoides caseolyticum]|uniref:DUF3310 domain-containing protein n=1 Tax=Macrococcoides caseolyticum TaxID=69966 RepID=UPI000C33F862|nr:DUF3310 domain-containing protein [Macrococcus caseolyticus]PKF08365.1 hypothetical protein CW698_01105 [Macrococcus caseolyticus]